MIPQRDRWVAFVSILLLLMGSSLQAGDTASLTLFHVDPGSSVTIRGSSNLSTWTCTSGDVRGVLRLSAPRAEVRRWLNDVHRALTDEEPPRLSPPPSLSSPPQARVAVPVRSFDCGSARMNRDMHRALKVNTSPRILFGYYSLEEVRRVRGDTEDKGHNGEPALQVTLVGGLVLAGRGSTIELIVTFERTGPMTYRVRAEKKTRMSRFGIEPPRALLGMIRARDPITLRFDMSVRPGPPSDTVPQATSRGIVPARPIAFRSSSFPRGLICF